MIGGFDIAGVFFSPLVLCLFSGLLARIVISKVLERTGLYQLVWNRPLFDMALLIILVGVEFALLRALI
ncbi:DUF1656 domain-containing protein [Cupriavidus pinatubonensis]|uniref:DUF1656 domain-containing protein n=1 Tax=Cupriavidus pinatubonensis TaxID=248026 RepID=A0ABN7ZQN1_9BURK|nr:DUF1656 domain-containing protein [Cupriavidus pinatubonensis]CAG9187290.1 hypothetical protein LMG23994_06735 [Cupriavidus pinatubonensis]